MTNLKIISKIKNRKQKGGPKNSSQNNKRNHPKKCTKIQITSLKCAGQAPFNQSSKEHLDINNLSCWFMLNTGSTHMYFYLHQFFFHMYQQGDTYSQQIQHRSLKNMKLVRLKIIQGTLGENKTQKYLMQISGNQENNAHHI